MEVLQPSFPPPGQSSLAKEDTAPLEASSDKTAVVFEAMVASPRFQQDLASTVLPAEGATKDKKEVTTVEADKPASQVPKIQIKLKK